MEVEAVEFSKETALVYDFDEYYRSKVIIPEGVYSAVYLYDTQILIENEVDYDYFIANRARWILRNISATVSPMDLINNYPNMFFTDTYRIQWLNEMDWDDDKTWIAVEIGENGLPNGKYLKEEFVRKPVPYEDYLGAWNVNGNYNITITEKEAGETFNIQGIDNQIRSPYNPSGDVIQIEAVYDAKTGKMSVASQEIAPPYEYNNSTMVDFLAANNTSYDEVGTVLMIGEVHKNWTDNFYMYAAHPDETDFNYLRFKVQDITNGYQAYSYGANNMYLYGYDYSKDVESDPSEKYEAWLGEWMLGEQKLVFSKDVANKSVAITGFIEDPEAKVIAQFDEVAGTLTFTHLRTGATIKKEGRYFEYYSVGQDDKGEYVWGSDYNQSVATLAIQEEGTIKVEAANTSYWVNYYEQQGYDQWPYDWGLIGTVWGYNWDNDIWCRSNGEWYVLDNVWFGGGEQFKFRKYGDWKEGDLGGTFTQLDQEFDLVDGGPNVEIPANMWGSYDILFNPTTQKAIIVDAVGDVEIPEKVPAAKFGVAPYNAALGWDNNNAVMFDIPATLTPVTPNAAISKMKAARAKKHVRPASTSTTHEIPNFVELITE
jgi:hypothetical protein